MSAQPFTVIEQSPEETRKAFVRDSRAAAIDMLANLADMVRVEANAIDAATDPLGADARHLVANALVNLATKTAEMFKEAYSTPPRAGRPLDALAPGVAYDRPRVAGDERRGFVLVERRTQ